MARGSIVKLADGTYRARVPNPTRPARSGAKLEKRFRKLKGKDGAERWVADRLSEAAQGVTYDPSDGNVTVEAMYERLRSIWRTSALKPTTISGYESTWRTHVKPRWGKVRVNAIRRRDVQAWVDAMSVERKAATVRQSYGLLQRILGRAVADERLLATPCTKAVKLPPARSQEAELWLTMGELRMLHNAIDADSRLPLLTMGLTGLRAGECWGLRRSDIDLARGILQVRCSLAEVDGRLIPGTPKSRESRRSLALDPALTELLRAHLAVEPSPRSSVRRGRPDGWPAIKLGANAVHWTTDADDPDRLVFTSDGGRPVRHRLWYQRRYRPAVVSLWPAGHRLHGLKVHHLRHTNASASIVAAALAGVAGDTSLSIVKQRLGHADIRMTENIYSHMNEAIDRELAGHLGAAWAATAESNVVALSAEGRR